MVKMTSSNNSAPNDGRSGQPAPAWAWVVGTFFGAGRMKPGPGTWGSAATILVWWVVASRIDPRWHLTAALLFAAIAIGIGIPAATLLARASGKKDPQFVVIDETAGQMITLLGAPLAWKPLLAGFLLFRAFDIVKPQPVRWLERLPEGTGIVVDDVAAGLYALAAMQLLLHFGWLS